MKRFPKEDFPESGIQTVQSWSCAMTDFESGGDDGEYGSNLTWLKTSAMGSKFDNERAKIKMNPISDSVRRVRLQNSSAEHVNWPQMTKRLSKNGLTSSWRFFLRYFGLAWLTLKWVPGWIAFSQTRDSSRAGYYATISWRYKIKEINFSKFETSVFKNIKVETMISWQ